MVGPRRRDRTVVLIEIIDNRGAGQHSFGVLEAGCVYASNNGRIYLCVFVEGMRSLIDLSDRVGQSSRGDEGSSFTLVEAKLVLSP